MCPPFRTTQWLYQLNMKKECILSVTLTEANVPEILVNKLWVNDTGNVNYLSWPFWFQSSHIDCHKKKMFHAKPRSDILWMCDLTIWKPDKRVCGMQILNVKYAALCSVHWSETVKQQSLTSKPGLAAESWHRLWGSASHQCTGVSTQ